MENYIVRIYRRNAIDPYKVAGVFESVEHQTESTFTDLRSLLALLATRGVAGKDASSTRAADAQTDRVTR